MNDMTKLGLLLPTVLNPATAAVIGIAAIAVGLYRMLPGDDEEPTVDAVSIKGPETVVSTVEARLPSVELIEVKPLSQPYNDAEQTAPIALETAQAQTTDLDQSEMIRKAMSELGKRSAAARAKKKAEQDQVP